VVRDDVVPSWEIDGRFGAQPEAEPSEDRYGGWLTAIAVVAILALGVAGVIFLPGLLAGGPARSPTPTATIIPSLAPSASSGFATPTTALPTGSATPAETDGPTAQPTVDVTPRLYRIRPGDSLARIARRFDTTVEDILAANPDIANPNEIQVGQFIVIPQAPPTAAP
jgi:LysM repeat protein